MQCNAMQCNTIHCGTAQCNSRAEGGNYCRVQFRRQRQFTRLVISTSTALFTKLLTFTSTAALFRRLLTSTTALFSRRLTIYCHPSTVTALFSTATNVTSTVLHTHTVIQPFCVYLMPPLSPSPPPAYMVPV